MVNLALWKPKRQMTTITNEAAAKMMKEGVQSFLAKPFTARELLNILALHCDRKQHHEDC